MKLFVILICIGLEKYAQIGGALRRFLWFDDYIQWLNGLFKDSGLLESWKAVVVLLLPMVLIVGLIYWIICDWFFGLFGLLFNLVILLYCLGPDDLFHQVAQYLDSKDKDKKKIADELKSDIPKGTKLGRDSLIPKVILILANERFFAVLFWYIILGPVGAVLYRMSALLRKYAEINKTDYAIEARTFQQYLDWIPARLTAMLYMIVGSFQTGFKIWCQRLLASPDDNIELIKDCAIHALNNEVTIENANELVLHSLVVVLVMIAIFTLGAWVY